MFPCAWCVLRHFLPAYAGMRRFWGQFRINCITIAKTIDVVHSQVIASHVVWPPLGILHLTLCLKQSISDNGKELCCRPPGPSCIRYINILPLTPKRRWPAVTCYVATILLLTSSVEDGICQHLRVLRETANTPSVHQETRQLAVKKPQSST